MKTLYQLFDAKFLGKCRRCGNPTKVVYGFGTKDDPGVCLTCWGETHVGQRCDRLGMEAS